MRATKELFDQHMDRLKQQAASNGAHPQAPQPTPQFFEPPPEPPRPEPPSRSALVAAPVSRSAPGNYRSEFSGKVTLTKDQLEAAKIAGVTPAEYARQLVKINDMKANGQYGEPQR